MWHQPRIRNHLLRVKADRFTTVNGNSMRTKIGRKDFAELDFSDWWVDCSVVSELYLHVGCPRLNDDVVYRVRCAIRPGDDFRKGIVTSIGIGVKDGRPHWIVRTREM